MLYPDEIEEERKAQAGMMVMTPSGWRPVLRVFRTKPLDEWELGTDGHSLMCSGHHVVKSEGQWVRVKSLMPGDSVSTDDGEELVVVCRPTGRKVPMYDLEVDDPSHSFFSSGIESHNSTTFAARLLVNSFIIPRYRSLYITPTHNQLSTFASRLLEMEGMFRGNTAGQKKFFKRYDNGSMIDLNYCLTSAKDIRGKTTDLVCIDESQNFDPEILGEVLFTLTDSDMPMTIYTGTALSIDTLLEAKWQASSMGMWHVRTADGADWLNMYDKNTLFKVCSNPEYPVCPRTGKRLDVTNGCFVHANSTAMASGRIGLHVPQCIIPDIAYNKLKWIRVYNQVMSGEDTKTLQECFGIAVAEGTREITQQDLVRMCVLPFTEDQLKEKCRNGYYRLIISGCDWGGSDYNPAIKSKTSYTVHCIIGVAPDNKVDILYFRRYSGMQYDEIAESIVGTHNAFNGSVMASDFGVGMAYNTEIRNYLPFDRHFIMNYVGPRSEPIAEPKGAHMANQLSVNRTEAITNVFKDVKHQGDLLIRCRDWSVTSPYLLDWLNMYRIPTELPSGEKVFKYQRAATKADDALHAFTFAYVLAKFYLGKPLVEDISLQNRLRAVMTNPVAARNARRLGAQLVREPDYVISG